MEGIGLMSDQVLSIRITGRDAKTPRLITGWHSFDRAFKSRSGDIGLPIRTICELSGKKGVGKSTLALSVAGRAANYLNTNIVLIDVEEHFDKKYAPDVLNLSGFVGELYNVEGKSDSDMLSKALDYLKKEEYGVGILDSVGAVSPISEEEGNLEDVNWGRRAKLMSTFSKLIVKKFREKSNPSILFATNHLHPNMGTLGDSTSGGETLRYL